MKARRISNAVTLLIIASAMSAFCLVAIKTNADNRMEKTDVLKNQVSPITEREVVASRPISVADEDKGFWLSLRASGFETKEISISAGDYFVVIQNATGLDEVALRIERETGQRVHEMRLSRLKKRWRQMVHFTPGQYVVSEVDHPEWTCHITVMPPQ